MMIQNKDVTNKQLKTFGIALSIFLSVIGYFQYNKSHFLAAMILFGSSLLVILLVLIFPKGVTPVYRAAMFFAHILGWINTRIILAAVYYLIFTPTGIIMKILGKDFLDRKIDKKVGSYWVIREKKDVPKEQYLKQF